MKNAIYNKVFWHRLGGVMPLLSLLACIHVYMNSSSYRSDEIPTLSYLVSEFPANQIYMITMNIEALILFFAFYIRINSLMTYASFYQLFKQGKIGFVPLQFLWIMSLVSPMSLSVSSYVPIVYQSYIHMISSGFFIFGSLSILTLTDLVAVNIGIKIPPISLTLSFLMFSSLLLSLINYFFLKLVPTYLTCLFDYICFVSLFLKVIIMHSDIPPRSVLVSRIK